MKKKTRIIVAVAVVFVLLSLLVFLVLNSPEYALISAMADVSESGLEGLNGHLTEDAQKTLDTFIEATDDSFIVDSLLDSIGLSDLVDAIKNNPTDIEFVPDEILKSYKRADIYIDFNYNDEVTGTIELKMVREDGKWKIGGFGIPKIDGMNLADLIS